MAATEKGQRLLKVFKALEEHPIIGVSNKGLADSTGLTPSQVTREMDDLIASGLAIKLDNGNFAYSVKTLQIAERFRKQQERLQSRLAEIGQRVDVI